MVKILLNGGVLDKPAFHLIFRRLKAGLLKWQRLLLTCVLQAARGCAVVVQCCSVPCRVPRPSLMLRQRPPGPKCMQ